MTAPGLRGLAAVWVLMMFGGGGGVAAQQASRTATGAAGVDAVRAARALVEANRLGEAEAELRGELARDPGSAAAMYLLGYVLERENRPRDSLAMFTQAAAIAPPRAEDLRLVALDYVLLDDYADALRWVTRATAMDPKNAEAFYTLGRIEMHDGNFVGAERSFRRTLALNAKHTKAWDNLGLSMEAQNRAGEALAAYTEAIGTQVGADAGAAGRRTEQPYLNKGALLIAQNRAGEAVGLLTEAVRISPECARCHEQLARADLATGELGGAQKEMREAIRLDPSNPRLHYQLGQMLRHAGLAAEADAELKRSAALYGSHSAEPEGDAPKAPGSGAQK